MASLHRVSHWVTCKQFFLSWFPGYSNAGGQLEPDPMAWPQVESRGCGLPQPYLVQESCSLAASLFLSLPFRSPQLLLISRRSSWQPICWLLRQLTVICPCHKSIPLGLPLGLLQARFSPPLCGEQIGPGEGCRACFSFTLLHTALARTDVTWAILIWNPVYYGTYVVISSKGLLDPTTTWFK